MVRMAPSCRSGMVHSASRRIGRWAICRSALRNYLVRLGWSHGDQEMFSTDEMIAAFDLPQIGRSPARFDFVKLENLNGHYIRAATRWRSRRGDAARAAGKRRHTREAAARVADADWRQDRTGDAGPQGAREDIAGTVRQRRLSLWQAPADDRRCGGKTAHGRRRAVLLPAPRVLDGAPSWQAAGARSRGQGSRRKRPASSSARSRSHCARRSPARRPRPASST